MGFSRSQRRVVAKFGRSGRLHHFWFLAQQRLSVTTLLILLLASTPAVADGISFDPDITQEEFHIFSTLVAQAIYPTPVNPGDPGGLLGFDIGVAATAIPIDEQARYWVNAVDEDILYQGYLVVPRLVASKGLGIANLSASYAEIPDTDVKVLGGSVDLAILNGGVVMPTLVLRGGYSELQGLDEFELKTYGGELILSKAFGPITPYIGGGIAYVESRGRIEATPVFDLEDDFDQERFTAGVRLSLLILKIVAEITTGGEQEENVYAAKVSLGF